MSEDHSLEEFASTDATGSGGTDDAAGDDAAVADGDDADAAAVADDVDSTAADGVETADDVETADTAVDAAEPAGSTYDYSPGGASCGACGERVTRRWRDDGDHVCADCKEW